MKKLLTILSAFFVACTLVACSSSNTPQAVAKQFLEATHKGDAETVFSLLYIPEEQAKKDGMEDMMRGKIKMMTQAAKKQADTKGGIDSISTNEPEYSEDKKTATVKATITFKNGEKDSSAVKLILADDGWKIGL